MEAYKFGGDQEPGGEAGHLLASLFHDGTLSPEGLLALISSSQEEVAQGGRGVFTEDTDLEFRLAIDNQTVTIAYPKVDNMFSLTIDDAVSLATTYLQEQA